MKNSPYFLITVVYKLKVFHPDTALFDSNRKISSNDVHFIAKTLGDVDIDSLKIKWLGLYSDFIIEEKDNLFKLNFDEIWKKILKCIPILLNTKI